MSCVAIDELHHRIGVSVSLCMLHVWVACRFACVKPFEGITRDTDHLHKTKIAVSSDIM